VQVSVSGIGSSRLDFEQRGLQEVVRASVSYFNNDSDIDALVSALKQLVLGKTHERSMQLEGLHLASSADQDHDPAAAARDVLAPITP